MSWHFLLGGVEAYWHQNCLDGAPDALLKLMPVQEGYCLTVSVMGLSSNSQFGMTCALLTENHGEDILMSLQGDSPAKTYQCAEAEKVSMASAQDYGQKWRGLLAKYDPASHSLRTAQLSLIEGLNECLRTWQEWGWMQDGECFERPALERHTIERGFSYLLTPTAQSWKAWTFRNPYALIRKNHADGNLQEQLMRLYQRMTTPLCQEILMMYPEGWTDSKPLAMAGFQRWLQEHSLY